MSMPPTVGPNVALVLQRLDLIERKIDWLAERVTWLTYSSAASTQESGDSPDTVRSSSPSRPETTPPSIAPQTRSASEHSWQRPPGTGRTCPSDPGGGVTSRLVRDRPRHHVVAGPAHGAA